jgi:hypothetical protein
METKTRTEQILKVMRVLTWIAFIGYCIEAGAILFSYTLSYNNPEGARNFYNGLDLFDLREVSFWYYTQVVSFNVAVSIMKAYVFFLVIKIFTKIDLSDPFKMDLALRLEKISYVLFGLSIVGMISRGHTGYLLDITGVEYGLKFTGEFLFMAGLIFIISQIFKRGVELQSENDLTV